MKKPHFLTPLRNLLSNWQFTAKVKKLFQFSILCLGIWVLIKFAEWVINDLITFRFESASLNDLMIGILFVIIFFGVPMVLADLYEKWEFLNRIYWVDKRLQEQKKAEIFHDETDLNDLKVEKELTKLDRILQAMDPEGREKAINLLQLYREKKKEAEMKNYQGIMKKVEEQKKQPLDLERALRQLRENSKD